MCSLAGASGKAGRQKSKRQHRGVVDVSMFVRKVPEMLSILARHEEVREGAEAHRVHATIVDSTS